MKLEVVEIQDVDTDLLELQRLILNQARFRISEVSGMLELSAKEVDALLGILNMLDFWSDERNDKT